MNGYHQDVQSVELLAKLSPLPYNRSLVAQGEKLESNEEGKSGTEARGEKSSNADFGTGGLGNLGADMPNNSFLDDERVMHQTIFEVHTFNQVTLGGNRNLGGQSNFSGGADAEHVVLVAPVVADSITLQKISPYWRKRMMEKE